MTSTATTTYRNLLVERRGAVTVLFVNRPDVLNALNRETLAEIEACALAFAADPSQGALIVTGSGEKSFISGADINELAVLDPRGAEDISRFGQRVLALPLDDGLRVESGQFGILAASEDMHEGLRAFLEKRPARFQRK